MCRSVTCKKCGKTTWAGCGMHVDQVMSGVPHAQRCQGHQNEPKKPTEPKEGFMAKLFGR